MNSTVRKEISSANVMSELALLGLFIPLIGWILGGIAVHKVGFVLDEDVTWTKDEVKQISRIRAQAYVSIVLSIVSAVVWWILIRLGNQSSS